MDSWAVRLDDRRREAGRLLLAKTDELGFAAIGAGWFYHPESGRWLFVLITPMVDTKGPRWIYERLLRIFGKWGLPPGIAPLDIHLVSPSHMELVAAESDKPGVVEGVIEGAGGEPLDGADAMVAGLSGSPMPAVLYRMISKESVKAARDPSRQFDLRVRQMLAA